jgi:hypothetical protein
MAMPGNPFAAKGGKSERLMGPGQRSTITGGNNIDRMLGNYSKAPASPLIASPPNPVASDPTAHSNAHIVRGGSIKAHPKAGGIGPGPNGSYGSATGYPKTPVMNPEDAAQ